MESQTASLVADHLKNLGFEVYAGIDAHGVPRVFTDSVGKTILMRAELDALPILEQTTLL